MWIEGMVSILITVISGVLVFIAGEILKEIWLTPLNNYKKLKEKISFALSYYANYYYNVAGYDECSVEAKAARRCASDEMRKLSCELEGFIETLSFFKPGIPRKENLHDASLELMGISNSFFASDDSRYDTSCANRERRNNIYGMLKLYHVKT